MNEDAQDPLSEYSSEGSPFKRKQGFHQEFHFVGIHGMMYDEKRCEANQGIEFLSIKEATERNTNMT